ncbi:TPA: tryptophanase leader peptide [Salmonella enterica subsp. enterica serovar Birkenhead]|nr:tryptophanase leader peptide [Salmonella enterica subsp. enterica serovar Birkenhead]HDN5970682.1 tryptophanase leader peptide [Salmonella enterica subsp. enterica serovar Birkenhead]HDN6537258.1 tryptophanase leader peptide [Salmonella enterica subsp. enterica serovar Birkenhead]HDN7148819.1 tryptophanase leader peptide [Salmonella enterica subsp. enterica serovar Birkenhead]HEC9488007.1 tryptophanase leader peptide [Salmonella enterica subsp. enterica serovar Orientalis]
MDIKISCCDDKILFNKGGYIMINLFNSYLTSKWFNIDTMIVNHRP